MNRKCKNFVDKTEGKGPRLESGRLESEPYLPLLIVALP